MSDAEKRQLKIKSGSVKRLAKELAMYQKERGDEEAKVNKMKADGAEPHDLKHAEQVLAEAAMIIPDTKQRLESAFQELEAILGTVGDSTEEHSAATAVLGEARGLLQ